LLADETMEAINRYIFDSEIYVLEKENRIIAVYTLLVLNAQEGRDKKYRRSPRVPRARNRESITKRRQ
jgi:hypothetical protein